MVVRSSRDDEDDTRDTYIDDAEEDDEVRRDDDDDIDDDDAENEFIQTIFSSVDHLGSNKIQFKFNSIQFNTLQYFQLQFNSHSLLIPAHLILYYISTQLLPLKSSLMAGALSKLQDEYII
jgi:hypothetical protein